MRTFSEISGWLDGQAIEVPSWAYGNPGTRFKVFRTPRTVRSVQEKVADAAMVHRMTGLAPSWTHGVVSGSLVDLRVLVQCHHLPVRYLPTTAGVTG